MVIYGLSGCTICFIYYFINDKNFVKRSKSIEHKMCFDFMCNICLNTLRTGEADLRF